MSATLATEQRLIKSAFYLDLGCESAAGMEKTVGAAAAAAIDAKSVRETAVDHSHSRLE